MNHSFSEEQVDVIKEKANSVANVLKEKIDNMIKFMEETFQETGFSMDRITRENPNLQLFMELTGLKLVMVIQTMYRNAFDKTIFTKETLKYKTASDVRQALNHHLNTVKTDIVTDELIDIKARWLSDGIPLPDDMRDEDLWKLYRYFLLFYKLVFPVLK